MRPENITAALVTALLATSLMVAGATVGTAAPATTEQPSNHTASDGLADNVTAEAVLDAYEQRLENLETLSLTATTESNGSGQTFASENAIWVDYENERMRAEVDSAYANTTTVRNESGTVTYNEDDNTVSRYDSTFGDRYSDVFGLSTITENAEVTYEGTETVNGTETYRLDLQPETQYGATDYDMTLWMNTETHLPVRYAADIESDQYSTEVTAEYTNVSVNETIADERFTIDVPEDAEEPDHSTPDFFSYENESELRANTSQSVPDPDLPGNFSFDSGYVTEGDDYSSVTLTYTTDDSESLTVSKRDSAGYNYSQNDDYEAIDIGNRTGYYNEFDYGDSSLSILVWECGDDQYTLYGSVNESESIDIAGSVDCE